MKKQILLLCLALTELPVGDSKADFIMINGRGVVYEIKTDLDNLLRLENQIRDYYRLGVYYFSGCDWFNAFSCYVPETAATSTGISVTFTI